MQESGKSCDFTALSRGVFLFHAIFSFSTRDFHQIAHFKILAQTAHSRTKICWKSHDLRDSWYTINIKWRCSIYTMKSCDGKIDHNIDSYTYRKSVAKCLHLMRMRLALSTYGCKNCIQSGHTEQSWAFGLTSFQRYCIHYKSKKLDRFLYFFTCRGARAISPSAWKMGLRNKDALNFNCN